jgi:hypothetical protein
VPSTIPALHVEFSLVGDTYQNPLSNLATTEASFCCCSAAIWCFYASFVIHCNHRAIVSRSNRHRAWRSIHASVFLPFAAQGTRAKCCSNWRPAVVSFAQSNAVAGLPRCDMSWSLSPRSCPQVKYDKPRWSLHVWPQHRTRVLLCNSPRTQGLSEREARYLLASFTLANLKRLHW